MRDEEASDVPFAVDKNRPADFGKMAVIGQKIVTGNGLPVYCVSAKV
jgi:hypothetical protein